MGIVAMVLVFLASQPVVKPEEKKDRTAVVTSTNLLVGAAGVGAIVALAGSEGSHHQAVPEPAPLVALGVGAIGLLRRRKR